jgi:predicted MFS family arabinose efflux permease
LKWSLAKVGWVSNILAPLISLGVSVLAGWAFAKLPRQQALQGSLLMVVLTGVALVPLSLSWYAQWLASVVVVVSIVAGVVCNIANKIVLIDKSAQVPTHSATFFTVQASIGQIGGVGGSALAPLLADAMGFPAAMALSCVFGVLAMIGVARYKRW